MSEKHLGELTPKLGFGIIRLSQKENNTLDMDITKEMVDVFLDEGFLYIDTVYILRF